MPDDLINSFMTGPNDKGRFGEFGGRFVSETLMPLILELRPNTSGPRPMTVSGPRWTTCGPTTWAGRHRSISPRG